MRGTPHFHSAVDDTDRPTCMDHQNEVSHSIQHGDQADPVRPHGCTALVVELGADPQADACNPSHFCLHSGGVFHTCAVSMAGSVSTTMTLPVPNGSASSATRAQRCRRCRACRPSLAIFGPPVCAHHAIVPPHLAGITDPRDR